MSRREALLEARYRWGSNGGVWERGLTKIVGRYGTICGKKRMGWIAGEGRTWEQAFTNADAKASEVKP